MIKQINRGEFVKIIVNTSTLQNAIDEIVKFSYILLIVAKADENNMGNFIYTFYTKAVKDIDIEDTLTTVITEAEYIEAFKQNVLNK